MSFLSKRNVTMFVLVGVCVRLQETRRWNECVAHDEWLIDCCHLPRKALSD